VARVRQARKCRANRTDGEPCGGWAIVGGFVCRAHGGTAPQVLHAAYVAQVEAALRRQFAAESARWRREWAAWQAHRVVTVQELTGVPWRKVTTMDIVLCHVEHGRPGLDDTAPKIRRDRRFKMPQPPTYKPLQRTASVSTNGAS
jgi:hypothetical protein